MNCFFQNKKKRKHKYVYHIILVKENCFYEN